MSRKKFTLGNHLHNRSDWAPSTDTDLQKAWLNNKVKDPDVLLLVKIGKFFEVFHEDADTLHEKLQFPFLCGEVARTGFPVSAIKKMEERFKSNNIKYKIIS